MTDNEADLAGANATLTLTNELIDVAQRLGAGTGAEPAVALFGAAMKILKEQYGEHSWVPLAQHWLQTVIEAENGATSYD